MGVVFAANAIIIIMSIGVLLSNAVAVSVSNSSRELKALMDFGWPHVNSTSHHCRWKGITCDDHGRVAELSLQSLVGSNDDEPECHDLGHLDPLVFTSLTSIHLGSCGICGVIPPNIGSLSNLTYLNLSHNKLQSDIPPSLANLSELVVLDLSSNEFSDVIPPGIRSLSNLIHLNLSHNQFESELLLSLANLSELQVLDISHNLFIFGVIPSGIGNLHHLIFLDLSFNNIDGSLPPIVSQLTRLEILKLDGNRLEGVFEAGIHMLPSIKMINISGNSQIPIDFGDVSNAQFLNIDFSWNYISGEVPESISRLDGINVESWGFYDLNIFHIIKQFDQNIVGVLLQSQEGENKNYIRESTARLTTLFRAICHYYHKLWLYSEFPQDQV